MTVSNSRKWLFLFSFLVVGGLIYSNTFDGPFHCDDPHVVSDISFEQMLEKCRLGGSRFIAHLSFLLNHWLHGKNVVGYHVFNILAHIGSACFLFAFLCAVLAVSRPAEPSPLPLRASGRPAIGILPPLSDPVVWPAFLGAMFFLVHPLATQAVTYIAQRYSSLAGFFYIGCLAFFVRARIVCRQGAPFFGGRHFLMYALSVLMAVLAMRTKEMTITLPAAVLLTEYYFVQPDFQSIRKRILYLLPLLFTGLIIPLSDMVGIEEISLEKVAALQDYSWGGGITRKDYLLTQLKIIVGVYLKLLVWPIGQNVDHDYTVSRGLFYPPTISSLVSICLLLGVGIWLFRHSRLLSFAILWFFVTLSPTSSIVPNTEFVAEHRAYISLMGIGFAAAAIPAWQVRWKRYLWALVPVILLLSGLTYARNGVWKNHVTLWRDSASKSPDKPRPQYNLGLSFAELGRLDEAATHFSEALRVSPGYADAHNNLGVVLVKQGKLEEAISHYLRVIQVNPNFAEAHNNLANALIKQGRLDGAITHYSHALQIQPDFAEAYNNLGLALVSRGRYKEAVGHYYRAVQIDPGYAKAYLNLGDVMAVQGDLERAVRFYYQALRVDPESAGTHYNLANALRRQGDLDEAARHYYHAIRIKSDFAEAHNNLGTVLMRQGKIKEAIRHFSAALRIKPEDLNTLRNLDVVLQRSGRPDRALE